MGHIAHITGAIFMYALIFGAFIAALYWRVRVCLRADDSRLQEDNSQDSPDSLDSTDANKFE